MEQYFNLMEYLNDEYSNEDNLEDSGSSNVEYDEVSVAGYELAF
jgi:hypothetical protein